MKSKNIPASVIIAAFLTVLCSVAINHGRLRTGLITHI